MMQTRCFDVEHADLIHDISYDFYGKRMATCSSDQVVKIWDWQPNDIWKCTSQWRNHLGPVWRVAWAHPEFGQVVATCSFDRTIEIWEELAGKFREGVDLTLQSEFDQGNLPVEMNKLRNDTNNPSNLGSNVLSNSNWVKRARFVDPRTSVLDIEFAPRHLGLQIACIDVGGFIRIYEARDVMNLSQWTLQFDSRTGKPGSCLSWSQSRIDIPLIAVGSSVSEPGVPVGVVGNNPTGNYSTSGITLSSGTLTLYECGANNQWRKVEDIAGIDQTINDLAFAPHMGQSFQQLAVATSNDLIILRIKHSDKISQTPESATNVALDIQGSVSSYSIFKMASFNHHKGRVWRVSWNVTGSLLASSGDDGCVRLWQTNYLGHWLPVSAVQPGGPSSPEISTYPINQTSSQTQDFIHQIHLGQDDQSINLKNLIRGLPLPPSGSIASTLLYSSPEQESNSLIGGSILEIPKTGAAY